jgi:hypothetical protein
MSWARPFDPPNVSQRGGFAAAGKSCDRRDLGAGRRFRGVSGTGFAFQSRNVTTHEVVRGSPVLRIIQTVHASGAPVIKLEGKLLAPWIDQVRALCAHSTSAGMPVLDLSALTFADQTGTQLLQEMLREGCLIEACTPFIAELLHWRPDKC